MLDFQEYVDKQLNWPLKIQVISWFIIEVIGPDGKNNIQTAVNAKPGDAS